MIPPQAILVVDETGFLKKGTQSVGVQRQYTGTAGKIENCQIGVFLAYSSPKGCAFLDRALYLPEEWAADEERRDQAGVPEEVEFATQPQLARRMLERVLDAGVQAAWVTGDEVYGNDRRLRMALEEREQPFVLGVAAKEYVWVTAGGALQQMQVGKIANGLPEGAWERISGGDGSKGPRLYDWARVPLERWAEPEWESRKLSGRRSLNNPQELAYYVVFAPAGTRLEELVQVAGRRWTIEEAFEAAKGLVGLGDYEVRRWDAWYRYITLALLASRKLSGLRPYGAQGEQKGGA